MDTGMLTRRLAALAILAGVMLAGAVQVGAAEAEYRVEAAADWVDPPHWEDVDAPEGQLRNGAWYLFADTQVRLSGRSRETYRAFAIKAVNGSGVDAAANIRISFDPSYQSLILHRIDVIRAGNRSGRLASTPIQVLQRETGLEYRIYDGSKTVNAFLDDVRVGDVVEYAYTLAGSNPVFEGREFGSFRLQFSEPAQNLRARLLLPAGRPVSLRTHNDPPAAVVTEHDGFRDHRWSVSDVAALVVEDGAPGWYDPYPGVQWSEFADWTAVANWAEPLYDVPTMLPPALRAEIGTIARDADPAQRLLGALRFVQDEIRYLGVEIGPGSHAPSPPALVFERRFGDCKDKTLLLLSMLRELGIEARPALVDTYSGSSLPERQPSPGLFDHVLVEARIGRVRYWVDPTRSSQRGDLEHLSQPDYGHALIVDSQSRSLTAMKNSSGALNRKQVRAVFDAREGIDQPVRYSLTSTSEGFVADSMRDMLGSSNRDELQQQYLNFYARYYPNIVVDAPLTSTGQDEANRLVVDEHYRITDFATWVESALRYEASIEAPDMSELLLDPSPAIRRAPLARSYPYELEQVTEILLPEAWPFTPGVSKVDDPAFSFERVISGEGARIVLTDRYVAKAPIVAAVDMPRYLSNLARAREEMAYGLQWAKPGHGATGADALNWPLVVIAGFFLLGWAGLAALAYRWDPPPDRRAVDPKLAGFGGWVLLPAFGILISPVRLLVESAATMTLFKASIWVNLAMPGGTGYHSWWAPAIVLTIAANLALLVFSVLLIVLLVQRRRSLPWAYTVFMLFSMATQVADHWWLTQVTPDDPSLTMAIPKMIRGFGGAVLWIAYFHMSTRVRSTFVRAHPRRFARERAGGAAPLAEAA